MKEHQASSSLQRKAGAPCGFAQSVCSVGLAPGTTLGRERAGASLPVSTGLGELLPGTVSGRRASPRSTAPSASGPVKAPHDLCPPPGRSTGPNTVMPGFGLRYADWLFSGSILSPSAMRLLLPQLGSVNARRKRRDYVALRLSAPWCSRLGNLLQR